MESLQPIQTIVTDTRKCCGGNRNWRIPISQKQQWKSNTEREDFWHLLFSTWRAKYLMSFCAITCLIRHERLVYRSINGLEPVQHVYFHCSMYVFGHGEPVAYCSSWVYKSPEMKTLLVLRKYLDICRIKVSIQSIRWSEYEENTFV